MPSLVSIIIADFTAVATVCKILFCIGLFYYLSPSLVKFTLVSALHTAQTWRWYGRKAIERPSLTRRRRRDGTWGATLMRQCNRTLICVSSWCAVVRRWFSCFFISPQVRWRSWLHIVKPLTVNYNLPLIGKHRMQLPYLWQLYQRRSYDTSCVSICKQDWISWLIFSQSVNQWGLIVLSLQKRPRLHYKC